MSTKTALWDAPMTATVVDSLGSDFAKRVGLRAWSSSSGERSEIETGSCWFEQQTHVRSIPEIATSILGKPSEVVYCMG